MTTTELILWIGEFTPIQIIIFIIGAWGICWWIYKLAKWFGREFMGYFDK